MNGIRLRQVLVAAIATVLVTSVTSVHADTVYNVNRKGQVIKGYDPVAYFTEKMPVKGNELYELEWEGARWLFASAGNMEMFRKDPEKYAPLYGGYCAYGVAVGGLYNIKPEAWSIVDGRLYLNKNLRVREIWRQDIPGYIEKANANWPGLSRKE